MNTIRSRCSLVLTLGPLGRKLPSIALVNVPKRVINISGIETIGKLQKKRSPVAYLFALLPVATFGLGTWQIYRRQWKLDLIAKLESLIRSDPIDFPVDLSELENLEYTKVKVRGHFDQNATPIFLFPRSLLESKSGSKSGIPSPGSGLISSSAAKSVGAQLVMPFVVSDPRFGSDLRILVNLGWVSREVMERANAIQAKSMNYGTINNTNDFKDEKLEEIELVGVVRKTEKREPFREKSEFSHGYWNRRDIDKMAAFQQTEPIFLDSTQSHPIRITSNRLQVNPIGAQTRVNLRNEHLSYIVTWYSLTGIFSYLWYAKIFKARL